jgi:hypothetical protein
MRPAILWALALGLLAVTAACAAVSAAHTLIVVAGSEQAVQWPMVLKWALGVFCGGAVVGAALGWRKR